MFFGLFFCCLEFCFLCEFSEGLGVLFLEAGSVAGLVGHDDLEGVVVGLLGFGGAFVDGGDLGSLAYWVWGCLLWSVSVAAWGGWVWLRGGGWCSDLFRSCTWRCWRFCMFPRSRL